MASSVGMWVSLTTLEVQFCVFFGEMSVQVLRTFFGGSFVLLLLIWEGDSVFHHLCDVGCGFPVDDFYFLSS